MRPLDDISTWEHTHRCWHLHEAQMLYCSEATGVLDNTCIQSTCTSVDTWAGTWGHALEKGHIMSLEVLAQLCTRMITGTPTATPSCMRYTPLTLAKVQLFDTRPAFKLGRWKYAYRWNWYFCNLVIEWVLKAGKGWKPAMGLWHCS